MRFTKQQSKAIHTTGKNLLISAGAGSGKTAVLSERVIEKIRNNVMVDRLVVLTFTNAAAKEMKLRIRKKLLKEDTAVAASALETLDMAHIRTFDSYALYLLKTYGHVYNISSKVAIGDTAALEIRQRKILEDIFETYYQAKDKRFEAFVRAFEVKNDQRLVNLLLQMYTQLSFYTNIDAALDQFGVAQFTEAHFEKTFSAYVYLLKEMISNFEDAILDAKALCHYEASLEYIEGVYKHFCTLFKADKYEDIKDSVANLGGFPTLHKVSAALKKVDGDAESEALKLVRKQLSDMYKEIVGRLVYSKDEHRQQYYKSSEHLEIVCELLRRFDEAFMAYQISHEVMTFASVARLTIKILEEHEQVRTRLRNDIAEIMVDEYQDTNHLQERFIELIANDNVFQVGDVKQSIYRFRHAEPKLFTQKLSRYALTDAGEAIALNANFRSRKEVLRDLNKLFSAIMDATIGGVDYTSDQALRYGNLAYDEHTDSNLRYGLTVALYTEDDVEDYIEKKQLTFEEMEMFYIAKDIAAKVGRVKVYDREQDTLRLARYDDFAILASVSGKFDLFKKVFELAGVPLTVMRSAPFMTAIDIDFYRNMLKLVHCFTDDAYYQAHIKHCFLSVARSFVFDFSDDLIVKQLLALPEQRPFKNTFSEKAFNAFFDAIMAIAHATETATIVDSFDQVLKQFAVAEQLTALDDTFEAKQRMMYLENIVERLALEGYTLKDLVIYFDALVEADLEVDFDTARLDSTGSVRLMTIHKSKGLEFPIVYVPSLMKRFNRRQKHQAVFDSTVGFLFPYEDDGLRKSYLFDLYEEAFLEEDVSERLRVLYVALTRAQEACIVPLHDDCEIHFHKDEKGLVKALERRRFYTSFERVMHSVLDGFSENCLRIRLSDYQLDPSFRDYQPSLKAVEGAVESKTYYKALQHERAITTKYSKDIDSLLSTQTLEAIREGNRMHAFLENIDFHKPFMPQIKALTKDQRSQDLLAAFFTSDLMRSLEIKAVYKEYPFMVDSDGEVTTGFIDLLVETEDAFVIIDYKLKAIDKREYAQQIEGYRTVLSKMTDKFIKGYLYSIIDQRFLKVL